MGPGSPHRGCTYRTSNDGPARVRAPVLLSLSFIAPHRFRMSRSARCSDIASVCGKAHMGGFVRKDEPWLRRALDLEDRLERDSWSSEHDSAGRRKQTIAQFARKVLP
jgi:hypothetical protein